MKTVLAHKRIAILGYGVNNTGLIPYLQQQGVASITVCDKNENLKREIDDVDYHLGEDYLKNLHRFDVIFRTPGIPYATPEIQTAKRAGSIITSQTQLFLEVCKAKTIGVTGTKGKGTTSTLIEAILTQAAKSREVDGKIYLAGNIGISPLTFVDSLTEEDWVILELSSFQLQDLTLSPRIAVVLNITIDHLDHHKTEAEYVEAKKSIVKYQSNLDASVIAFDSPTSRRFANETKAKKFYFSTKQPVTQGSWVEEGSIVLTLTGAKPETVCTIQDIPLVGEHNLENITAAVTASALAGASLESIREGIICFKGLPHRIEFIKEVHGVKYYDDSKATTPDSTIAAIKAFDAPTTLIVGGSSKGADFTELIETITNSCVNHVICIGEEGERIRELLEKTKAPQEILIGKSTMREIVKQAAIHTAPGSVVLLSPAAASFDMFKNAEDRGNQFQDAVMTLGS